MTFLCEVESPDKQTLTFWDGASAHAATRDDYTSPKTTAEYELDVAADTDTVTTIYCQRTDDTERSTGSTAATVLGIKTPLADVSNTRSVQSTGLNMIFKIKQLESNSNNLTSADYS